MSDQIEEVEITRDEVNLNNKQVKPKKQLSEQQLLNLKKARERDRKSVV